MVQNKVARFLWPTGYACMYVLTYRESATWELQIAFRTDLYAISFGCSRHWK